MIPKYQDVPFVIIVFSMLFGYILRGISILEGVQTTHVTDLHCLEQLIDKQTELISVIRELGTCVNNAGP
jgi:hypothetical protein|tara:strand:- start:332 stop:541 length:210 start_codon:yes stop_codon:yes gene_type:complete